MRSIMARMLFAAALMAISFAAVTSDAATFPGKKSSWNGYDRYEFIHDGCRCYVVTPKKPGVGKPWIWRARFFGHEPQADLVLLSRGFHLAYCDVAGLFGSPKAVAHWNAFYRYLTEDYGLARKPALEGMSRGGLIIYNWAIQNPDKVACIYGDAPVCDIRSWPGKKYGDQAGVRAKDKQNPAWAACLKAYGLTEEQAMAYRGNPVDNLKPLAEAKVPILHVCGDADTVVPMAENTDVVARRYRALGGSIKVIVKHGVGHHPHSLKDPTPIVEFIVKHTPAAEDGAAATQTDAQRPNIIFFLSDDQRADFLGCAGHPILKTPVIDDLARRGVRMENAFVTTSICAASRATIFTGLYERTHRFTFGTPPIAEKLIDNSYPVLLRAAGYRTGFVGKFGVAAEGKEKMFDDFQPLSRHPYFKKQPDGSLRHLTEIAGDRAIQFLKECPRDKPFCLSVSFNAAHAEDSDKVNHYPWPKAVDGLYEDVTIPPPKLSDPAIYESQPDFLKKSLNRQRYFWRWDTPEKYQRNVKAYYRMITGLDRVIGRVLDELKRLGRDGNTVVIFCGDNGYYKGSRGFAGKWSHYEESLRVPLVIFDPRLDQKKRGRVVTEMALNVDIPATILDLAGVQVPGSYQGRSLVPLVQGAAPADWRTDFFCEHLMEAGENLPKWEGVRGRRYVYARYFQQQPVYEFLHDLKKDPDELKNFAGEASYAEALEASRRRCDELRDKYGGVFVPHKRPSRRPAGR